MHVRKRTYKNKQTGKRETCRRWQVVFRDHLHQRVSIPAFADKKASEEFGRRLERLVSGRIAGTPLDAELTKWLDGLPGSILARLGKIGLVDSVHMARAQAVSTHVDGWRASLVAKAVSKKEIRQKTSRVNRIISGCDFRVFTDINGAKVADHLASLRHGKSGIARQTSNHYLRAIKQFTKWMLREGRANQNPLEFMSGQNVRVDRRRVRRALTPNECRRLLSTTADGPRRRSMSGPERALLYRLALETGLRASEL